MCKWMKIVSIVIALLLVSLIATQAVTIHNMKKDQEEQFYEHIEAAAQGFEKYLKNGHVIYYNEAVRELDSAYCIARLLNDSEDYINLQSELYRILFLYGYSPDLDYLHPEYLDLYLEDIVVALNKFTADRKLKTLCTDLYNVNFEINQKRAYEAERAGLSFNPIC